MAKITVVPSAPGIGKSTAGAEFVGPSLEILNEDEMVFKYRTQGYPDYKEQAIFRLTQVIRSKLIRNDDFVLELNLGYPEHYDYILLLPRVINKPLKSFYCRRSRVKKIIPC